MPSSYYVEFTAFINERIRPEGFPREVKVQETFENIENTAHLQFKVNERFIQLVTSAGLIILKNPTDILDSNIITFDKRWFVPWHMITHMGLRVERMPQVISTPQDSLVPHDPAPEEKPKDKVN